jgi:hypothetical protein
VSVPKVQLFRGNSLWGVSLDSIAQQSATHL